MRGIHSGPYDTKYSIRSTQIVNLVARLARSQTGLCPPTKIPAGGCISPRTHGVHQPQPTSTSGMASRTHLQSQSRILRFGGLPGAGRSENVHLNDPANRGRSCHLSWDSRRPGRACEPQHPFLRVLCGGIVVQAHCVCICDAIAQHRHDNRKDGSRDKVWGKKSILMGIGYHSTENKTTDATTKISPITPAWPLSPIPFQPQKTQIRPPPPPLPSAFALGGFFIQRSLVYAFSIIVQEKIPRMMRVPVELGVR